MPGKAASAIDLSKLRLAEVQPFKPQSMCPLRMWANVQASRMEWGSTPFTLVQRCSVQSAMGCSTQVQLRCDMLVLQMCLRYALAVPGLCLESSLGAL